MSDYQNASQYDPAVHFGLWNIFRSQMSALGCHWEEKSEGAGHLIAVRG